MTWNRFPASCFRIPINAMRTTFSFQRASVSLEMPHEIPTFHGTSTSSAPDGMRLLASSLRSTRRSSMASFRFPMHSSRVSPWPFASGNSAQNATNHAPSRTTCAVIGKFMLSKLALLVSILNHFPTQYRVPPVRMKRLPPEGTMEERRARSSSSPISALCRSLKPSLPAAVT